MDEGFSRQLPTGWKMTAEERSAGVYEVWAVDPWGRKVSAVDSDLDAASAKVAKGAADAQRQLDSGS